MFTRASRPLLTPSPPKFSGLEDPWNVATVETPITAGIITTLADSEGGPSGDTISIGISAGEFASWAASGTARLIGSGKYRDPNERWWDDFWHYVTRGNYRAGDTMPFVKSSSTLLSLGPVEFSDGDARTTGAPPSEVSAQLGLAEVAVTSSSDRFPCFSNNDLRGRNDIWHETDNGDLLLRDDAAGSDAIFSVSGADVIADVI